MLAKISLACLLGLAAEAKKHMTLAQLVAESQQRCCDNACSDEPEEQPGLVAARGERHSVGW